MVSVSIIVPVYNTAKYLSKCLDSILGQTLKGIEIICIDDGSVDESPQILDSYAEKDSRIKVIHKKNEGLVAARKDGVHAAQGEYIGFVDSDDWAGADMYEKLYRAAEDNDADMVSSNYWQEGNYSNVSEDALEPGVYEGAGMDYLRKHCILYLPKHDKGMSGSLCTKIFRTSMLQEIMPHIPEEIRVSEDKVTTVTFLLECRRAVVLDAAYYHYRINQASMFHAEDPEYLLNYHRVYTYFRSLYRHPNFTDSMRKQAELYIVQFLIKGINAQMGFSFRNLMWIDPVWMETPGLGKRVALCGRGDLGRTYEQQIRNNKKLLFAGYVDLEEPSAGPDCDSIVITSKNHDIAEAAKEKLIDKKIPGVKIFWFRQEEIFWRYAEAMGLLEGEE